MSRTIPSRQALRHLSRLCNVELQSSLSPARVLRGTLQRHKISLQPTPIKRSQPFSSTSAAFQTTSSTHENNSSPSSASLPDITSYYTLFPSTIPSGPPPAGSFNISVPQLRKEFLRLQSQHHPDKYTASPTAHQKALALSAFINAAYKTLSDPLLRAQYLLREHHDIDVMSEDNSSHPTDQETLMEVMEAQEKVEDATEQADIDALKDENNERITTTEEKMAKAFETEDVEIAKNECIRLKYWRSLKQGLDDWEPGKEVRLIH